MKGKHHIIIETDHLKYEFDIKRNITVIQGDSATGKTTLIGLLQEYGIRREASGIRLQSDVPCEVYAGSSELWQTVLSTLFGRIVFIDEGYPFIYSKAFAEFIDHSDNYFVLITRKPMRNLPYSINEIYGIRTSGKYHFPDKVHQEFYPIYENYRQ
ncbi:MAG: Fis family transcriptional regulator [Lachnospiraceae bacterium]|nr:Fis family transcriptional regulator [Lachnospiraceae bacterium]